MMKKLLYTASLVAMLCSCSSKEIKTFISQGIIDQTVSSVLNNYPQADSSLLARGVTQAAALWQKEDGSEKEFIDFMSSHFEVEKERKEVLFIKCSKAMEVLMGNANHVSTELQRPIVLAGDEPDDIDYILGTYNPYAHLSDDFFSSKAAFVIILNFPHFTHAEKEANAEKWTRLEWAYARLGDYFTTRVPASVVQEESDAMNRAENYISSYNIMMGHLISSEGEKLFPEDMVLLSHWNLRDEIKSNYADVPMAQEKQEMIYKVMERIVTQEIPAEVINNPNLDWNPYSNEVQKDGITVSFSQEKDTRYFHILDQFHSFLKVDAYSQDGSNAISRCFDEGLEFSMDELENMFDMLLSSPQIEKVGSIIKKRLGRDLRPYDIWYDGFKSRSKIPESELTAKTKNLYPNAEAFHEDTPRLLMNLGFTEEDAKFIHDRVKVEPARGSGHALQCESRDQCAFLRTRIGTDGMDYKGFNIATHEFGHNVEQVLSLYKMDYYTLRGIPDNGFTEALAFLFQIRDLQLLGYGPQHMDSNAILDKFWSMYEIMGVSMVEMECWKWLYSHTDATPAQYKEAVLTSARNVWNKYFEPILGTHDSPILAIYSHMVNYPMYLPSYSIGDIVHFQLEQHLKASSSPAEFASEIERIYTIGHLTPNAWMREAVGSDVSIKPVLDAVNDILL